MQTQRRLGKERSVCKITFCINRLLRGKTLKPTMMKALVAGLEGISRRASMKEVRQLRRERARSTHGQGAHSCRRLVRLPSDAGNVPDS